MNREAPPNDSSPTYREYLANKAEYSAGGLSHYFNGEMGIASNVLGVLRARIDSLSMQPEDKSAILLQLDEAALHLSAAHEIANATFDLLIAIEDSKS